MASKCVNPECVKGVTPGIIGIGRGKTGAPLINNGQMTDIPKRWGWVACRACNPDEHAPFVKKNWSKEEIQERARLADAKAPYVPEPKADPRLARVKASSQIQPASAPPPETTAQLAELTKKISDMSDALSKSVTQNLELTATVGKLSGQVAELLAENARLRTAATAPISAPDPSLSSGTPPKKRKSRQIAKPS